MKVMMSIYDRKMMMHTLVLVFATVEEGVRSFDDSLTPDNRITLHPEDYSLMRLGTFNEETGIVTQDDGGPKLVVGADMLLERREVIALQRQKKAEHKAKEMENIEMWNPETLHREQRSDFNNVREHSVKVLEDSTRMQEG